MSSLEVEKNKHWEKLLVYAIPEDLINFDDAYNNYLRQLGLLILRVLTFNYYQDKFR